MLFRQRHAAPAGALLVMGGAALLGAALGVDQRGAPVAAGATAPEVPVPAAGSPSPSLPRPAVLQPPDSPFAGTWSGALEDPDTGPTDARVVVDDPDRDSSGRGVTVELLDLGCTYEGTDPRWGPDGSAITELGLEGEAREECAHTATVALSPRDDPAELRYDVVETCDDGECTPREATGILTSAPAGG